MQQRDIELVEAITRCLTFGQWRAPLTVGPDGQVTAWQRLARTAREAEERTIQRNDNDG